MKVLVLGAGGVGAAFGAIAQRRAAFERVVLADLSPERVRAVVEGGDVRAGLLAHVEMQIAVAGVAVGNHIPFGRQLLRKDMAFLDQYRDG